MITADYPAIEQERIKIKLIVQGINIGPMFSQMIVHGRHNVPTASNKYNTKRRPLTACSKQKQLTTFHMPCAQFHEWFT